MLICTQQQCNSTDLTLTHDVTPENSFSTYLKDEPLIVRCVAHLKKEVHQREEVMTLFHAPHIWSRKQKQCHPRINFIADSLASQSALNGHSLYFFTTFTVRSINGRPFSLTRGSEEIQHR